MKTERTELVAFPASAVLALIEGERAFKERFGYTPAEGLRGFFLSDEVSEAWLEAMRAAAETDEGDDGFAVVDVQARKVGKLSSNSRFWQ